MQYFYVVFEQTMEIDEGVTQMKSVKKNLRRQLR